MFTYKTILSQLPKDIYYNHFKSKIQQCVEWLLHNITGLYGDDSNCPTGFYNRIKFQIKEQWTFELIRYENLSRSYILSCSYFYLWKAYTHSVRLSNIANEKFKKTFKRKRKWKSFKDKKLSNISLKKKVPVKKYIKNFDDDFADLEMDFF